MNQSRKLFFHVYNRKNIEELIWMEGLGGDEIVYTNKIHSSQKKINSITKF